ncbi:hypothetical protein BXY47_3129 [Dietzia kunjamensis]|uniref:hypothetical protein n=1 Tax=Dietzia kunjamensis TaxID=322509 RepID=UPI000FF2DFC6|nr:hypothetical protein [Dietzia kunjamensis]MBB1013024.1 hypothetical protein [Dietzia kunjamensis]RKE58385.1 hypothetical protein BXY47_3129 [Dietzia kunjamensis]
MSDTSQKPPRSYLGISIALGLLVVAFALVGLSIATNPYGTGPVGAIKRHFPVTTTEFFFKDSSHQGSDSLLECDSGPDLTEGERLVVTADNGAVMGTFPLQYTGGKPSHLPEPFCAYEADISSLPSGQGMYHFTITPNPRIMISCTEAQLRDVKLTYWPKSQSGSCSEKTNLTEETVYVKPPSR